MVELEARDEMTGYGGDGKGIIERCRCKPYSNEEAARARPLYPEGCFLMSNATRFRSYLRLSKDRNRRICNWLPGNIDDLLQGKGRTVSVPRRSDDNACIKATQVHIVDVGASTDLEALASCCDPTVSNLAFSGSNCGNL